MIRAKVWNLKMLLLQINFVSWAFKIIKIEIRTAQPQSTLKILYGLASFVIAY